jgi:hypothetical protein
MIPKSGKPLEEASSYRPISLLPIMSKIFEKAVLKRSNPPGLSVWISTEILSHRKSTPNYEDNKRNFRKKKQYFSSAFLHITQVFDKVWHPGLLFKIRKILPHAYYRILESYLTDSSFK